MRQSRVVSPLRRRILFGFLLGAAAFATVPALSAQTPGELPTQDLAAGVTVDSIQVEGNQWVESNLIVGTTGLVEGATITFVDIQEAERRLWATGRFRDIQVFARGGADEDDPVILTFRVQENPVVSRIRFEGLENLRERDVRDEAGLRVGEPYSPQRSIQAQAFIRRGLAERGIPFASIEEELIPIEGRDGEVELVLNVWRGGASPKRYRGISCGGVPGCVPGESGIFRFGTPRRALHPSGGILVVPHRRVPGRCAG